MSHDEIVTLQRQIAELQKTLKQGVVSDAELKEMVNNYIKIDSEWKERANPMLEMFENGSGFAKTLMVLFKFLGAIGVAGGGILVIKLWAYKFLIK